MAIFSQSDQGYAVLEQLFSPTAIYRWKMTSNYLKHKFFWYRQIKWRISRNLIVRNMAVHQMFLFTALLMDCGWSEWNSWSNCTKPVGGIQTRKRECTDPQLTHGWRHCNGTGAQLRECSNMSSCQEGNIQIAAFLISVDKTFYFETKLRKFRNKSWNNNKWMELLSLNFNHIIIQAKYVKCTNY